MLTMDTAYLIKKLDREGCSQTEIAKALKIDRKTVRKYILQTPEVKAPFKKTRETDITPYMGFITDELRKNSAITAPKNRLTAKRIHTLLREGKAEGLPPLNVSVRTVQRAVKKARAEIKRQRTARSHIKLVHTPGEAQLDFGEVAVLLNGIETKLIILVLTFPQSNFRLAHALPAQNFECLAHGLVSLFERCGRVPLRLRCDNMSTAVAKIIKRGNVHEEAGKGTLTGELDHPRLMTENFANLARAYGFEPEFCNPASGNEKGSVENAVGWVRRNFFIPNILFDGNYAKLNDKLHQFCLNEAKNKHYIRQESTIEELFKADYAVMHDLPDRPFEACSWSTATVSYDKRVTVDTNQYQVDLSAGTEVCVKKTWNSLEFFTTDKKSIGKYERSYENRKDFIDWKVELEDLVQKPSAFKNSLFGLSLSKRAFNHLSGLMAPKRKLVLNAVLQKLKANEGKDEVTQKLELAIEKYGALTVEQLVIGFRGMDQTPTDAVKPITALPAGMATQGLEPVDVSDIARRLGCE